MLGKSLRILSILLLAGLAAAESIPAGSNLTVRTSSTLSSGQARVGQAFDANLTRNLVVRGKTIARAGAPVRGKVTFVKASGRLHDPGQITLRLTSVEVDGKMVPIATSSVHAQGKGHKKGNLEKIGGGAAGGALIGALLGGGKGAAIGAGVGAGAGTGVAAATGKEEAVVPAETALSFITR